jgi:D-alanyl-D-alanine carboxypeptidase/D-alanyl-D-alanine-endopeptidase (penicillin-binding protein 4)
MRTSAKGWATFAGALLISLTATGCATTSQSRPAADGGLPTGPAATARPKPGTPTDRGVLPALVRDIDAVLAAPALQHGYWGVLVKSLNNNDTLYALNARKLMMPASNMKIVTLAAAAEKLGWDYRYETRVVAAGPIANGTLDGDLVVVGSGDPSVTDAESGRLFADWAAELRQRGISRITGRIVGDDNAFTDRGLGFGWSWDDLPDDYAAAVSALQFNENAVRVTLAAGPAAGDFASVVATPATSGLILRSSVKTGEPGSLARIDADRLPGSAELILRGSIPPDSTPITRVVSVDNPTLFFVSALRQALIANGIDVHGAAVDIDDLSNAPAPGADALITYRSAPLSTLAVRLMKVSQNLYAETFLTTISPAAPASAAAGRAAAPAVLAAWGVTETGLIQRDGSGLSRYDYITPEALVTILTHIHRDERLRGPFEASLPIAGRDGGLSNRMKGTAAEGNARAKTGSMSNVRALSGFVTSGDGEPLVFSIVANNFETAADVITKAADAIVVRLAEFRR